MKLLQEVRGLGELQRPNAVPMHSPLFLIQLRSHLHEMSRPRRRVILNTAFPDEAEFPHPVKINHVKGN